MEIILIMLFGAILNGLLASSRGRSAAAWALLGGFFPLISLLILVLLPDMKQADATTERLKQAERVAAEADHQRRLAEMKLNRSDDVKQCPRCAETIKAAAIACRFCGYEYPAPDASIAVENKP